VADREPSSTDGRLSDVNPGTLPQADHARHDRWLVVRAASHDDDLTPAEAALARALLDGCDDCASLAADITTISRATAVSLAPSRPRDFRLTPAQAASAHGGVFARAGRWLASPRAGVLRPLAGASLAIGIVLVAVGPSIHGPLQPQVPAPNAEVAGAVQSGAPVETSGAADTATPSGVHIMDMQIAPKASAPAGPEVGSRLAPSGSPDTSTAAIMQSPEPKLAGVEAVGGASPAPDSSGQDAVAAGSIRSEDDTAKALVLLGIVLVGTGILVLALTWLARRMTRGT